jgi:hypothetical protein
MFARVVPAALLSCLPTLVASCADEPHPPAPRTWPQGTVLALNDTPISADDVDDAAAIIARVEPDHALPYFRRVALTNIVLPKVAGIQLAGTERHAAARALVETCKREIDATGDAKEHEGVLRHALEGDFNTVGLEAWNHGLDAEIGRWSDPIETVGAFQLVRVDARTQASVARKVDLKLSVITVPYVDSENPRSPIEAHIDRSTLEFVDDAWRDVVPESWKHRLRGGSS